MGKVTEHKESGEIKACCATFYESDVVRMLLGDILHPGGLELTVYLGQVMGLSPEDRVLDVACGRGSSAVHLAKNFGCHVTGIDYGADNVTAAREYATTQGTSHLTIFQVGDAEGLPFDDSSFDAIISECSYCTFPDKMKAASEMFRVLRPDGRTGITDMVVNGMLPEDIQSILSWVSCIAGASSANEYVSQLQKAGFASFTIEDKRDALIEMVSGIRRKFLAVELASGLWEIDLGGIDLNKAKNLAQHAAEMIEKGVIGYALIMARKRKTMLG
ncbi:2-methoxy-6-polyprenyl-1,4-benzoquinol methylase [subsurface metagenome]